MINAEKYKDDIIDEYQNLLKEKVVDGDGNRMNKAIKEIAYKYCGMRLVGASSTFKWLCEEYKEPVKLTRLEYEFLKWSEKKGHKYIVRDKINHLFIFKDAPIKRENCWVPESSYCSIALFDNLFKFIKQEDSEPTSIQEVLENCEVVEDAEE